MLSEELARAAVQFARNGQMDLLRFARTLFLDAKNFKWQLASHHVVVCAALERVLRGETRRLVINIPPRYSKTQLVKYFIAQGLGLAPDSEFIYTSYSARLAAASSWDVRGMVQQPLYRAMYPAVELRQDSQAKDEWRTTQGGIVYAVGAQGTITGYGAGKARAGFAGCFPVGTMVWTEIGFLPIEEIVRKRKGVRIWSYDYNGNLVLRPVSGWHENPPNDIFRVSFDDGSSVECTADHKFWTDNRGWVRADSLRKDDRLPRVNGKIEPLDNVGIDAKSVSGWSNSHSIPAARISMRAIVKRKFGLALGQFCSVICAYSAFIRNVFASCDGFPCVASPNLIHYGCGDSVLFGKRFCLDSFRVIDFQRLLVSQDGDRVNFRLAESSMPFAIFNVCGAAIVSKIIKPVVSWISIRVANVLGFLSGADKRQQNKAMHRGILDLAVARKTYSEMSARFCALFEKFSGLQVGSATAGIRDLPGLATNHACIADGIKPFISGYRSPRFIDYVRHDESTFCLTVEDYHNFIIESGFVVKNCLIIDDPHKADEASSDVIREGVLEWFQTTLESRLNSRETPIILIMQRLHERDLSGWLLAGGNGEKWEHVCLPAITERGEALWPEKHALPELRRMEQANPYVFAGQYLQRPAPPEGGLIKPDALVPVDAIPAGVTQWVRGWDFGATTAGDYTAGAKLGRLADGRFVIADLVRLRVGPDERDSALKNTAARDGLTCTVSIPQDPGQAGLTQAKYLVRELAGFHVKASPESGDKVTRAGPLAAQINVGNVLLLKAPWNDGLISEMRLFPNGAYDDQVDALSRAFMELVGNAPVEVFIPDGTVEPDVSGAPTCGRCAHFAAGACQERGFGVRAETVACDGYQPRLVPMDEPVRTE